LPKEENPMPRAGWTRTTLWLAGTTLLICGCSGAPSDGDGGEAAALSEAQASKAMTLFQDEGCPACHGDLAGGIEGAGPALRDLAPYWDVERLATYLEDPEAFREANPDFDERRDTAYELEMPAYDYLSRDQRELLGRWLLER
jgi:mono/diheme cytochrome c family protein